MKHVKSNATEHLALADLRVFVFFFQREV